MKKNYLVTFGIIFFIAGQLISQSLFTGKPRYQIVTRRNNIVLGVIKIELYPNLAPKHVRNFDSLVSKVFYDTTAFHRVAPNFVIQGGDPNSRHGPVSSWGYGQPGQPTVDAEFTVAKHLRGTIGMARGSNINSATSQFFIDLINNPPFSGQYTVFGRVTDGMTVVDTIALQPTVPSTQRPTQKIEMFITYIGSNDTVPVPPQLTAPADKTKGVDSSVYVQLKWNRVNDALLYHLDVSTDSLFITDTIRSLDLTNTVYPVNQLKGNTTYYWRVTANNGGHFSQSPVWSFKTIADETNIQTFKPNGDLTVFPNPTVGKFMFSNLVQGSVIEISDLAGRLVFKEEAVQSSLSADLSKKDKGLYLYKISIDNKMITTGKLILE